MIKPAENYPGMNLMLIPPVISKKSIDDLYENAEIAVQMWDVYIKASLGTRAVIADVLDTNLTNSTRHSILRIDDSCDANRIQLGRRPQNALLLSPEDGVNSVEILASLVSSDDEPHNALTTAHTNRALEGLLKSSTWKLPINDKPRARFKVTRCIGEDDELHAIVRSKVDQQGYVDTIQGDVFGIKGRRTGFVDLSEVDSDVRNDMITVMDQDKLTEQSEELILARENLQQFFESQPQSYQAIVDRAYVTR